MVTTADNVTNTYTWNIHALPKTVVAAGGGVTEQTQFFYPNDVQLGTITFPLGNTVTTTYDPAPQALRSRGNVLSETRDPAAAGSGEILTRTMAYDPKYNLPSGLQEDFSGRTRTITLDAEARAIASISYASAADSVSEAFEHNATTGQLERHVTPEGLVETWQYDPATGFLDRSTVGGRATLYEYSGNGAVLGRPPSSSRRLARPRSTPTRPTASR
ncbi:MAG: hypothetical protein IT384_29250 [Deltaproteobacteria bacterium]|nr:hypothetical protein [Deltaproteobacteria bacterium]